jgi:PilZ domain
MAKRASTLTAWDHDGRRAERLDVRMKASLREAGLTRFDVDVIDMSVTGFRIKTAYTLYPDSRVWLTLPGKAALEAKVAWRRDFTYGCRFIFPLHLAVFEHLVALYQRRGQE